MAARFSHLEGNPVSGLSPEQQSYAEFVAVQITWFYVFFWFLTVTQSALRLLPETFTTHDSSLSVFRVYSKLLRPMLPYALAVMLLSGAGGVGVACSLANLRPTCTGRCFAARSSWPSRARTPTTSSGFRLSEAVRKVLYVCAKRSSKGYDRDREIVITVFTSSTLALSVSAVLCPESAVCSFSASGSGLRAPCQLRPITTKWVFVLLGLCSLVLKILVQELAKRYLQKLRTTPSMRSMAAIVAAPTILVDTQLRTTLLCHSNVASTLVSSVALAAAEISLRVTKTLQVRRQLRRTSSRRPRNVVAVVPQSHPDAKSHAQPH